MQRGCTQAVDIVAEIDVGKIALEYFILGQPGLEPESDQHFARLTGEAALRCQKCGLGQLLGNRAAALGYPAAGEIAPQGPRQPARINPPVRIEAPVLDRHEGFDKVIGQLRNLHRVVDNRAIAGERLAVGGQQGDLRWRDRLQGFRQRCRNRKIGYDQEEYEQHRRCSAADPPPFAMHFSERSQGFIDAGRDCIAIGLVKSGFDGFPVTERPIPAPSPGFRRRSIKHQLLYYKNNTP